MLMNEVIPVEIRKMTNQCDKAFTDMINVSKGRMIDYGDGVYFGMPNDPRGQQLMRIRELAEQKAA